MHLCSRGVAAPKPVRVGVLQIVRIRIYYKSMHLSSRGFAAPKPVRVGGLQMSRVGKLCNKQAPLQPWPCCPRSCRPVAKGHSMCTLLSHAPLQPWPCCPQSCRPVTKGHSRCTTLSMQLCSRGAAAPELVNIWIFAEQKKASTAAAVAFLHCMDIVQKKQF
jgi:hypothetical protein